MTKSPSVLFSSVGRRVELLRCFRRDARELNLQVNFVGVDFSPELSPACREADSFYSVPKCHDPKFLDSVLDICHRTRTKIIIPTIDPELLVYSENLQKFEDIGVEVSVSEASFVRLARNKLKTIQLLKSLDIRVPETLSLQQFRENPIQITGPLVFKPADGSSSVGIAFSQDGLEPMNLDIKREYIVQEMIRGEEYTVNLFFDRNGKLKAVVPHRRIAVRTGEVSKGVTTRHPAFDEIASKLSSSDLGIRGPICFQAIVNGDGLPFVFEINARFGGGFPLAHQAGAQFSKWILEEGFNLPCTSHNQWEEHLLMLRYDDSHFVRNYQISNENDRFRSR